MFTKILRACATLFAYYKSQLLYDVGSYTRSFYKCLASEQSDLLLRHTPITSNTGFITYQVTEEVDISGRSIPNVQLSPSRLMEDYYMHNRVLRYGLLNGVLTEFKTIQKLKKQITLHVPFCYHKQFSGLEAFITDLSANGELLSAEYDTKTDLISLDILHEIEEGNRIVQGAAYNEGYNKGYDTLD